MKYSWEYKLQCVENYKTGKQNIKPKWCKLSNKNFLTVIETWVRLYDLHGIDGLKHKQFNKDWTAEERFELVAKVLAGQSIASIAVEAGIGSGLLCQWVRKYKILGYEGLELNKRGRPPKDPKLMKKVIDNTKLTISEKEELKLLKRRNEYLEAENAYLKKVRALVIEKNAKKKQNTTLSAKAKKQDSSKN